MQDLCVPSLPLEVCENIYSFSGINSIIATSLVSRQFVPSDLFWKEYMENLFRICGGIDFRFETSVKGDSSIKYALVAKVFEATKKLSKERIRSTIIWSERKVKDATKKIATKFLSIGLTIQQVKSLIELGDQRASDKEFRYFKDMKKVFLSDRYMNYEKNEEATITALIELYAHRGTKEDFLSLCPKHSREDRVIVNAKFKECMLSVLTKNIRSKHLWEAYHWHCLSTTEKTEKLVNLKLAYLKAERRRLNISHQNHLAAETSLWALEARMMKEGIDFLFE